METALSKSSLPLLGSMSCDAWRTAHAHQAPVYALADRPISLDFSRLPAIQQRHSLACLDAEVQPRNVFIDAGTSWCNTLMLFRHIPGAPQADAWNVWGFEVAPLIMPFVERCAAALSRGEALPSQPVPPSGSSSQLLKYAGKVGCHHGSRGGQFVCIEKALNTTLQALRPDLTLLGNHALVRSRLHAARTVGLAGRCKSVPARTQPSTGPGKAHFTLVPAAFGVRDGSLEVSSSARGLMQLLRGGVSVGEHEAAAVESQPQASAVVPVIDAIHWLRRSFAIDDFVVLKLDIEGAENDVVPALLATNTSKLIDVFLWECHLAVKGGSAGKCRCDTWERALLASGVGRVFRDPYPFAQPSDYPPFVFQGQQGAATAK